MLYIISIYCSMLYYYDVFLISHADTVLNVVNKIESISGGWDKIKTTVIIL